MMVLGHYIQAHHQDAMPGSGSSHACAKSNAHHKWMETSISFDAYDCPKNMAGAGQLPLVVSSIITNIKLHHVLIDGGEALNLISLVAF
jgi:hypothetical protein